MSRAIGFDFGTTNSLISIVDGNRCMPLLDKGLPHPSVVCYQGSQVIVGRKAKERLSSSGVGVIGNIVRSPKSLLGEHKVYVEGVARSPRAMVADIVRHVREHAELQQPGEYGRAVVTIPVDMKGERRRELREAFRMAGMNITQFIHEPLAALYGHLRTKPDFQDEFKQLNRELILVFDWGGGTLDLTLCQIVDGMLVQIKNDGCSNVGGDIIDDIVRNEIVRRSLKARGVESELPQQADATQKLLDRAERAKIELSTKESFSVFVPDYFLVSSGDRDIEYKLTREELEEMVSAKIEEGIQRINKLLEDARISPSSVALCLATGGMVNMPLIKSRLREIFGPQRLHVSERGNTIISEGAAWIAYDKANLSLAKNVELLVAPNTYFPVIKAGVSMPRDGMIQSTEAMSLYCTDPRDGTAKFQIASPTKPGRKVQSTDERTILDCLSIKVDHKADPFFERLVLNISVDENLILQASVHSLVKNDNDSVEIHNLEFGLELPVDGDKPDKWEEFNVGGSIKKVHPGSVSLRPNVSTYRDDKLIPGELLYKINPLYFDLRYSPPEHQDLEKLYYQPCSFCRRPSNHPLCHCASQSS
jgi:actin-like ATPase involved in cell morphogenesis